MQIRSRGLLPLTVLNNQNVAVGKFLAVLRQNRTEELVHGCLADGSDCVAAHAYQAADKIASVLGRSQVAAEKGDGGSQQQRSVAEERRCDSPVRRISRAGERLSEQLLERKRVIAPV